jgi:hypothetical protein
MMGVPNDITELTLQVNIFRISELELEETPDHSSKFYLT